MESAETQRVTARYIRLPVQPAGTEAAQPTPETAAPSTESRSVLVVDDNVDAVDSLGILFSAHGHDVTCVYEPSAALESARTRRPDVIVCDIGLPGMSAYYLAWLRRAELGSWRCLFIAVTGCGDPRDRQQSLGTGFDQHMTKPVDPVALLRQVTVWHPLGAPTAGE